MTEQDAGDGREEDLVRGEEGDEDAGGAEEIPGVDGVGEEGADEEAFAHG